MNVMEKFLQSEVNSQELYDDLFNFIISFHVRNGEFEGNEYIVKKMDRLNFIIFPEYTQSDGEREFKEVNPTDSLFVFINKTGLLV